MLRKLFLITVISLSTINVQAQEKTQDTFYRFEVKMDSVVQLGKTVRVHYEYTTNDSTELDIVKPQFGEGMKSGDYEVIIGPSTSTSRSYRVIKGKKLFSFSFKYTFIVSFLKEGSFTIPPVSTKTKSGRELQSEPFNYRVTKETVASSSSNVLFEENERTGKTKSKGKLLKMEATVNKDRVCIGDTVNCEFRLYTDMDVTRFSNSSHVNLSHGHACRRKHEMPVQRSFEEIVYNGKKVRSFLWDKFSIIPVQSDSIVIEPVKFNAVFKFCNPELDNDLEVFFNGGGYIDKDSIIASNRVTIQVDDKHIPANDIKISTIIPTHSLGIVVDRSSSLKSKVDSTSFSFGELEDQFLMHFLQGRTASDYSLTFFAGKPHFPTSSDLSDIQNITPSEENDGSAVYDALLASVLHEGVLTTERSPYSILLLTDGDDNASRLLECTLVNILLKHKVRVDVVVFGSKTDSVYHEIADIHTGSKRKVMIRNDTNYSDVERIAQKTNGQFLLIENESQIPKALSLINSKLQKAEVPHQSPEKDFRPNRTLLYTLFEEIMSDAMNGFK